jgi:Co/Zn/Cd efflux system component
MRMSLDGGENDSQHSVNSTHALIPSNCANSNPNDHSPMSPILEMSFRMAPSTELPFIVNGDDLDETHKFDCIDPDVLGNEIVMDDDEDSVPSNESILGVAFLTFLSFALTQMIFAFIAGSQAMMGDSAAMLVDSVTYLFNFIAERKKHQFDSTTAAVPEFPVEDAAEDPIKAERIRKRNRRKMVLQLEILPPTLSVTTLVLVTIFVTTKAVRLLRLDMHRSRAEQHRPNVNLMLAFSVCNLVLDGLNVFCFARAKHLMGYSTTTKTNHVETAQDDQSSIGLQYSDVDQLSTTMISNGHGENNGNCNGTVCENPNTISTSVERNGYSQVPLHQNRKGSTVGDVKGSMMPTCQNNVSGENTDEREDFYRHSDSVIQKRQNQTHEHSHSSHHQHHHNREDDDTNLNMCSAYTHVFADTLRSLAVIVAAVMAEVLPNVTPEVADATAAVIVAFLILLSLIPLIQGLVRSTSELRAILREEQLDMAFFTTSSPMGNYEMT